jgi:hypothetical protein
MAHRPTREIFILFFVFLFSILKPAQIELRAHGPLTLRVPHSPGHVLGLGQEITPLDLAYFNRR